MARKRERKGTEREVKGRRVRVEEILKVRKGREVRDRKKKKGVG